MSLKKYVLHFEAHELFSFVCKHLLQKVQHNNIIGFYDFMRDKSFYYLVIDYFFEGGIEGSWYCGIDGRRVGGIEG